MDNVGSIEYISPGNSYATSGSDHMTIDSDYGREDDSKRLIDTKVVGRRFSSNNEAERPLTQGTEGRDWLPRKHCGTASTLSEYLRDADESLRSNTCTMADRGIYESLCTAELSRLLSEAIRKAVGLKFDSLVGPSGQ